MILWPANNLYGNTKSFVVSTYSKFNLFHATGLFRYPLKTSEDLWFSVFRVHRKRPVA